MNIDVSNAHCGPGIPSKGHACLRVVYNQEPPWGSQLLQEERRLVRGPAGLRCDFGDDGLSAAPLNTESVRLNRDVRGRRESCRASDPRGRASFLSPRPSGQGEGGASACRSVGRRFSEIGERLAEGIPRCALRLDRVLS